MPKYDLEGARKAGVPDSETIDFLSKQYNYDLEGARGAGISDQDILNALIDPPDARPDSQSADLMQSLSTPAGADTTAVGSTAPTMSVLDATKDLPSKAWNLAQSIGKNIAEHRLTPLAMVFQELRHPGDFGTYMVTNGLEQHLAEDPDTALEKTIRGNLADLTLTGLDIVTLGKGAAINSMLRQTAAKVGLKGALGTLAATTAEGAAYGATYEGLASAIEGETIGKAVDRVVKGTGFGAGGGFVLGAGGVALQRMLRTVKTMGAAQAEREAAARAAEQTETALAAFDAALAEVTTKAPGLPKPMAAGVAREVLAGRDPHEALMDAYKSLNPLSEKNVMARSKPKSYDWQEVSPVTDGTRFFTNLKATRAEHKFGAAVEVKDPAFYTDPSTKLFLSNDGSAGAAVTRDGDLVSVFKRPGSTAKMDEILQAAAPYSKTLDGFDIGGKLPDLYAKHGFRPVARMPFNKEFAPEGWNYEVSGEPDVVFMVRDPKGLSGAPEVPAEGYASIREQVPVVKDWDTAKSTQATASGMVGEHDDLLVAQLDEAIATAGTAPNLQPIKVEERARTVPFYGPAHLRKYLRAQGLPKKTIREKGEDARNFLAGAFTAEPGATPNVARIFLRGRQVVGSAPVRAAQDVARIFDVLQGNSKLRGAKSAWLSEHMDALSKLAHSKTHRSVDNIPSEDWERAVFATAKKVEEHPDIVLAERLVRAKFDEMASIMVTRGYADPGQYVKDYLPMERIFQVATDLATQMEGTTVGRTLSAMLERGPKGEYTKTNVVELLHKSLTALYRKMAEDDMWVMLEKDPNINLTRFFKDNPGATIPPQYKLYRPGPGMSGYRPLDAQHEAAAGSISGMGIPKTEWLPGDYVLPADVATRLEGFYARRKEFPLEKALYETAKMYSRHLTIYSFTNTPLNALSDPGVAMLGLPGEKADMIGFIQAMPRASVAAVRGSLGLRDPLRERAMREGISGSTFVHSVETGNPVPLELRDVLEQNRPRTLLENVVHPVHKLAEGAIRIRQAVEETPRIAAGIAAEKRTGIPSEFARVGQDITLPFGAGDPALVRDPIVRLMAPFWRWTGLMTERMARMVVSKGSRTRGIMALTVPSTAAALWNLKNDEFREAEYSLSEYDRKHLHIILQENGHVRRDKDGRPIIMRMRFWAPEEVMGFWGLGNLAGRAVDVKTGYTTPGEFVKETGGEVMRNVAALPAALVSAGQLLTGRSSLTGEDLSGLERAESLLPSVYFIAKTADIAANRGPAEAIRSVPERIVGIRPAGRRGGRDTKVMTLERKIRETDAKIAAAASRKNKASIEKLKKRKQALQQRLSKLNATRAKLRGEGE